MFPLGWYFTGNPRWK